MFKIEKAYATKCNVTRNCCSDLAVNRSFQKSYKPAKRKLEKKKTMKANAKVDEWMEKMNTEFSEIEGFELSIEDNA